MHNKVQLIGNLGKDPVLRYTHSGTAVTTFSLATSEKRKNKDGEIVEKTEWHKIVTWNLLAEQCHDYLLKGRLVFVEGKIQTRSYEDQDGNKRYVTEIIAEKVKFLEKCAIQMGPLSPAPHQTDTNDWADEEIPF